MSVAALFNGLTGLSAHQRMLDVAGHNIANMNTRGYKRYSLKITENSSSMLRPALAPTQTRGGLNPMQIGYGVKVSNVSPQFTQGSMEATGRDLDLAMQGEGFFILDSGVTNHYTRVGNFTLDSQNYLVDQATGYHVVSANGNIRIPTEEPLAPQQSSSITMKGNLDPSTVFPGGVVVNTSLNVYDSRGESHAVDMAFAKTGTDVWQLTASLPNGDGVFADNLVDGITFNPDGSFNSVTGVGAGDNRISVTWNGLAAAQDITFDFGTAGTFDGLTHVGGGSTAAAVDQDGYTAGSLLSLAVQPDGSINGRYSNGQLKVLDQLQIATFSNPEGLEKTHDSMYLPTANSGQPLLSKALTGRAGSVVSGSLETSNVDITQEIAQMIIAQRGYQVNARVISVANQLMEEAANLTR